MMPTNEENSEIADLRPEYEFDYRKAKPNRFALTEQQRIINLEPNVTKYFWDLEAVKRKVVSPNIDAIKLQQKDELLKMLLQALTNRGIGRLWSLSSRPYSDLLGECREVMNDEISVKAFQVFLQSNPIVQNTVETLLSLLAMTSNAKWQDTPDVVQPLARRGWYISRWLPTFLIIDGPLGRFLTTTDSPLNSLLKR